jgi:hypothetical protein
MPSAEPFENSASFLHGVADAVREIGVWEGLERDLDASVFTALRAPKQHRWWPGSLLLDIAEGLERVGGPSAVERVGYLAVKKSIASVAMPLVRVTLALAGPAPDTILSRASMFGTHSLRGVDLGWKHETATSGVFQVTYPRPVPAATCGMWVGTLRFVLDVTQYEGTIEGRREGGGERLALPVSWKPQR